MPVDVHGHLQAAVVQEHRRGCGHADRQTGARAKGARRKKATNATMAADALGVSPYDLGRPGR